MTRPRMLLQVLALGSFLTGCSELADDGLVNDEDTLTAPNGLSSNGLSSNGLTSNGLSSNGLSSNGLSSNGLSSNGVVMTALREKTATGDLTRGFFRYLISCALGPNQSVTYTWTDAAGQLRTEINPGGLGLAPGWADRAATQDEKEIVSACLGARTNSKGLAVPLSMRAKNVSGLSVSAAERSSYSYGEGAFWGNLFNGFNPPALYSCSRTAVAVAPTSQYLSQGRTCATGNCGVITYVGPCFISGTATTGQACFEKGGSNDWVSACNAQKSKTATSSARVMTTWLAP